MSSSTAQAGRSKQTRTKIAIPVANGARIAGYPNAGSYVIVSPVLVPYVPAPIHYVKGKSKRIVESSSNSPVKVRYLPTYAYTTCQPAQYLYYNRRPLAAMQYSAQCLPRYAMPVNQDVSNLSQGYVSALTPPATYLAPSDLVHVQQSELNPLSRPYTPPSRMKVCRCDQKDETEDETWCPKHSRRPQSGRSSPDIWYEDSVGEATSRGATPVGGTCPCCRGKKASNLSDTDSGVEGESDDEGWCTCYRESYSKLRNDTPCSTDDEECDADYLDLRLHIADQSELTQESSRLIEFLCENLHPHEWRTVARELGVSDVIIQSVEYDVYDSFREQMKYVFSLWVRSQEEKSYEDKCKMIDQALAEIGRNDMIGQRTAAEAEPEV